MINKSDDIIASLRNNLKQIINLYENQKEENKILKQKNGELIHQISLLTKEKETLKNKNDNTDLKNAFIEASGSNHEAKIKVNRIVREIDKCIALLNKQIRFMDEKLSIRINIIDRYYPLKIERRDEESGSSICNQTG